MSEAFIGKGWAYPVHTDRSGGMALVSGDQELAESIRLIIGTALGERPMRPEFGCGIHDLIFAPADSTTAGRAAYEVRRSLRRWEPRIEVEDIDVRFDEQNPALMYIGVTYKVKGANDPRNLVFPFYTIPAEV